MNNVAQLISAAAANSPKAVFGTFQQQDSLDHVLERARDVADQLRSAGLARGDVAAVIGTNCAAYIVTWMAAQLAGIQAALINPSYPDEFLDGMLDDLMPRAIIWVKRAPGQLSGRKLVQFDATGAWEGQLVRLQDSASTAASAGSGEQCAYEEIAAYLHTSGTTGNPKFCALSHGYFLRLGRYFADTMQLSRHDVVVNPLPLFHINPTGNGVTGALTGNAGFLSTEKFSVIEFWPKVIEHRATVLILHGPPANMLKTKTTADAARGHCVRAGFSCDPEFLEKFGVPIGIGGYGSTEAGGYCHSWTFRPGDRELPSEGALHLSGQPRYDIECRLAEDGEILVRGRTPQVLFSGYAKGGKIQSHLDQDGWFHTGDRGRYDAYGNLIFLERSSESIRVNAEYVPIDFVEERLKRAPSLRDFALWKIDSPGRGHEAVVYTSSEDVDLDEIHDAVADLPNYMRPTQVILIKEIPRDAGVGKIQRRLLGTKEVLQVRHLGKAAGRT